MPTKKARKGVNPSVAASSEAAVPAPKPAWPALKPLVPSSDLALETVLADQIVVIRKLFPASLCQRYVSFLSALPLATTPGVPKKGEAVRVNDRFEISDWGFAEQLWRRTALKELVEEQGFWGGELLGLNPRIRIYRYSEGQFFGQHCTRSPSRSQALNMAHCGQMTISIWSRCLRGRQHRPKRRGRYFCTSQDHRQAAPAARRCSGQTNPTRNRSSLPQSQAWRSSTGTATLACYTRAAP